MSDIKLFSINNNSATELASKTAALEKHLQQYVESNMETLLYCHSGRSRILTFKSIFESRID